jgi:NAD-dependent aldehyde dehydrogenases
MRIMERAAKRLAKVSLECGGKFPAIICKMPISSAASMP